MANSTEKPRRRWSITRFWILLFIVGIPCLGSYSWILLIVDSAQRGRVLSQSLQPATVHYDRGDPYELRIQEGSRKWNYFLDSDRHGILEISQPGNEHVYGYKMDVDTENGMAPNLVQWTKDGVELTYPSGIKLFIPKKSFMAGR